MNTFNEFCNQVKNDIIGWLPEEFCSATAELKMIEKSNGIYLTGLVIKKEDSNIAPTIYLDKYYDMYNDGKYWEEIMEQIAAVRTASEHTSLDVSKIQDYEEIREYIFPQIVGKKEWNEHFLEDKPYMELFDLAVVFVLDVTELFEMNAETGRYTVVIKNDLMKSWDKTKGDLLFQSIKNIRSSENFKPVFRTMRSTLGELVGVVPGYDEDVEDNIDNEIMFVLSNERKMYGASVVLAIKTLRDIYDKIGEFVMIPSSIHEWLILRKKDVQDLDEISQMIVEINETQVDKHDRMSDHPYIFDGEDMRTYEKRNDNT